MYFTSPLLGVILSSRLTPKTPTNHNQLSLYFATTRSLANEGLPPRTTFVDAPEMDGIPLVAVVDFEAVTTIAS
jgi:hypothetical protein